MPILVYLEGGGMENVGLFYGHLVFFSDSLHILLVPGKSGNPGLIPIVLS
jgi:hypothetical protein